MADSELDTIINEPSEAEKRIKQLSGKVKEEAEAKETERKAREEAEAKAIAAQKETEFYKNFSTISGKYSGAADHIDEIKAKVMAGYDIEDAAIAVTSRAQAAQPVVEQTPIAGGSAVTNTPQSSEKGTNEMSTDEKRKILEDRSDEIYKILSPQA